MDGTHTDGSADECDRHRIAACHKQRRSTPSWSVTINIRQSALSHHYAPRLSPAPEAVPTTPDMRANAFCAHENVSNHFNFHRRISNGKVKDGHLNEHRSFSMSRSITPKVHHYHSRSLLQLSATPKSAYGLCIIQDSNFLMARVWTVFYGYAEPS